MSKMGQWVMEMQEDAASMTQEDFVNKHGVSQKDVWEKVQDEEFDIESLDPDERSWYYDGDGKKRLKNDT
jgi:hypothetical protein